jgi:hypothetical protein
MVDLDGRGVFAINVGSGKDAPYGVRTSERHVSYYVRRAANTFPATPADVRAFVQARVNTAPTPYFPTAPR